MSRGLLYVLAWISKQLLGSLPEREGLLMNDVGVSEGTRDNIGVIGSGQEQDPEVSAGKP